MRKFILKTVLILSFVVLVPTVALLIYEVDAVSNYEKIVKNAYLYQLEAAAYTINQYVESVVSNWADNIEEEPDISDPRRALDTETIHALYIFSGEKPPDYRRLYHREPAPDFDTIRTLLDEKQQLLTQLENYYKQDYRKLEVLSDSYSDQYMLLLFRMKGAERYNFCIVVINTEEFIEEIVVPQLQLAAKSSYYFELRNEVTGEIAAQTIENYEGEIQVTKPLWLLPSYETGVAVRSETISEFFEERYTVNILIVGLLFIILTGGMLLVYRNIRNSMKLVQMKSDFVANVSHELRTPLALISMYAETLDMGRLNSAEKRKEYHSIIYQEASRLSGIVNKILSFSKMEAGKKSYSFESVDINYILEEIFDTYKFHLENSGFKFSFKPQEDIPNIKADRSAVEEAVTNLLDNAVKYSAETKEITIQTGISGGNVYINIADKGIGIDSEDINKIFDKFFRVSTGDVHNIKGTGLGLALVKHIMDAHKGKINVKSRKGEGSTFTLLFPAEN